MFIRYIRGEPIDTYQHFPTNCKKLYLPELLLLESVKSQKVVISIKTKLKSKKQGHESQQASRNI